MDSFKVKCTSKAKNIKDIINWKWGWIFFSIEIYKKKLKKIAIYEIWFFFFELAETK